MKLHWKPMQDKRLQQCWGMGMVADTQFNLLSQTISNRADSKYCFGQKLTGTRTPNVVEASTLRVVIEMK